MATCRKRENGTFEFVVRRKRLLPKPIYLSFDTEEAGRVYCDRLEKMLDAGVVPDEFKQSANRSLTLAKLIREYIAEHTLKPDDVPKLQAVALEHGSVDLKCIDYQWAADFIASLKRVKKLAPGTVSKYVGALRRCLSWGVNAGKLADNPFLRIPKGYAQYTETDERLAGLRREDVSRDIRLSRDTEKAVLDVIAGKQTEPDAHRVLFILALETAMRLGEMLTLECNQVDLDKRTIFLDKTKNGDKRQVPLSSTALTVLREYTEKHSSDYLFPWWTGDHNERKKLTSRLSKSFARIFKDANCPEVRFHDLRHEATSRFFERTALTDLEIAKITGHKDPRMLMRYANLRGSSLADKLW